jgi:hypothetical protein
MLELTNGDLWATNMELEDWTNKGKYDELKDRGKCLPRQDARKFIEQMASTIGSGNYKYEDMLRKWTPSMNGYWNCNFSYEEIFRTMATDFVQTPWATAYVMPWGHVYVLHQITDGDGTSTSMSRFDSFQDYFAAATTLVSNKDK